MGAIEKAQAIVLKHYMLRRIEAMKNTKNNIQARARQAIESMYKGVCKIEGYEKYTDPQTHITRTRKVTICENQPCKLSFETLTATNQTESVATQAQGVKLFISPDLDIPAGCVITVTQEGRTSTYNRSGVAAVYPTHQEIILELEDEYA